MSQLPQTTENQVSQTYTSEEANEVPKEPDPNEWTSQLTGMEHTYVH